MKPASPSTTASNPSEWTTAQMLTWLMSAAHVHVKKRGEIFEKKGWTRGEVEMVAADEVMI